MLSALEGYLVKVQRDAWSETVGLGFVHVSSEMQETRSFQNLGSPSI
jgi:hypothetical protein